MATSTITHTVTGPTGTALEGVPIIIRLVPRGAFRTADGTEVAPVYETTTNASGVWSATLERNSGISPANSFYEVEQQLTKAQGGPRKYTFQVGASNATLYASLVSPIPDLSSANYLTQTTADARYLLLSGGFGVAGDMTDSRPGVAASAGTTALGARIDHVHDRETQQGTAAVIAALSGTDLIRGYPYITTDANNITGTGIATPDTTSQPARADSLFVKNAQRFQPGFWNQPWGVMGYAQATAAQNGIGTSFTDVTSCTITFTAAANRRYKITGQVRAFQNTSTGAVQMAITDGSNNSLCSQIYNTAASTWCAPFASAIHTPAAGSFTYKLRILTSANTVNLDNSSATPAWILIEDIGPNGAAA